MRRSSLILLALLLSTLLVVLVLVNPCVLASLPSLQVPKCPDVATASHFMLDSGAAAPSQSTTVQLCYDEEYLVVNFNCVDNNIFSEFTQCNDPLYEEDVVEMFIAPSANDDVLSEYYEFEISPNGVLFAAHVLNPHDTCAGIQDTLLPCAQTGIVYNATREDRFERWSAMLMLPFKLIGNNNNNNNSSSSSTGGDATSALPPTEWKANFFRVDTPLYKATEYSCWSPTMRNPPCFHVPSYFGTLTLV